MINFFIWLLKFIPEWLIFGAVFFALLANIATYFLPLPIQYKLPVKIGSIFIFVIGVYLMGMSQVVKEFESQRIEFEHKLEVAEVESQNVNEKIKYIYKDRIVKIQEKSKKVQDDIEKKSSEINKNCKMTAEMIDIHNLAAGAKK